MPKTLQTPHLTEIALLTWIVVTPMAAQQGKATFTTIDVPGATSTTPTAINTAGTITGTYMGGSAGENPASFVRTTDGTITTFAAPGGIKVWKTLALAINGAGTIAGYYILYVNTGNYGEVPIPYGFVRTADGTFTTLSAPGLPFVCYSLNCGGTYITGINANGTVAGYYQDTNFEYHGLFGDPSGTLTTFDAGTPTPNLGTTVSAISATGTITGYYSTGTGATSTGFVRTSDGTISTFSAASVTTTPESINTAGSIAGTASLIPGASSQAFVRDPSGNITTFQVPGAQSTVALSINAQGGIAGYARDKKGVYHAFLRSPSGTIRAFEAPGAGTYGSPAGTEAIAINHTNSVTGWYVDSTGVTHGFLLTP